ncbi:MAG: hypothetical protein OEP48_02980 [Betaproteobacteria bacterium]|nr:hypothetical protein [Betaproteobacteria bacterium]MDH3436120.1 hypothetical protein [Betaproteobacteria bacterium]
MQKPGLILLAGLLVAACDSGSKAPPADLMKSQREAMEKAKQTEAVIDLATADRLKRAEKDAQ